MLLWTIILFLPSQNYVLWRRRRTKKRSFWKLQTFPNIIVSKMPKYINFRWFWIFHPFEVEIRTTLNPNAKLHPIIPSFAQNTSPLPSQVLWDSAKKLSLVESWVCVCVCVCNNSKSLSFYCYWGHWVPLDHGEKSYQLFIFLSEIVISR
jgi:hypothetical protein